MKRCRGFLLVEVLLSVVILTSGLLVIVRGYYVAGKVLERSRTLFRSSLLLEDAMFEPESRGIVKPEASKGTCPSDSGYSWSMKVSPVSEDEEDKDLSLVELTVSSKERRPYTSGIMTYLKTAPS